MAKAISKTVKKAAPIAPSKSSPPDGGAFVEPSERSFILWSPALIRAAETQADSGNLRLAAGLCDSILADDRAEPVLRTRVRSLFGADLSFEASGDGRRGGAAERAAEADEDFFTSYPEDELGQLLIWGLLLGVAPAKQAWIERAPRIIPRISFWHPASLRYDWDKRQWFTRVAVGPERPISAGDGTWILNTPGGTNRPWNSGLWRQFARWWLLKAYAMQDFGRHSEVHGNPIMAGLPKDGAAVRKEDRQRLAADLAALGRNSSIALPPGFDLKLIEATARTWEMFQAQINLANTAMAVAALGQNMTTEPGANQNGISGAREVRTALLNSDAQTVSTLLREQSGVWWAEFNFGDRDLAPWPVWDTKPPEDRAAKATAIKTFADSISSLSTAGYDVENAEEIGKDYGLVLKKKAPAPPAPDSPAAAAGAQGSSSRRPGASASRWRSHAALFAGQPADATTAEDDGQAYAEGLSDASVAAGAETLEPDLAALLALIEGADSFESLQKGLLNAYQKMSASDLAALTEKALILAELAGRHAILREI